MSKYRIPAPQRIKVKFFLKDGSTIELPQVIPVFHRWIQAQRVEGLLLDVADYKHVPHGPGIMLIGHEADYAIDQGKGRLGLLYDRKREWSDQTAIDLTDDLSDSSADSPPILQERLQTVFRNALRGCQALEADLPGQAAFAYDEAEITFSDRLRTPNQPDVYEAIHDEVQLLLDELYAGADVTLERVHTDVRRPLAIRIKADVDANSTTLLERIA